MPRKSTEAETPAVLTVADAKAEAFDIRVLIDRAQARYNALVEFIKREEPKPEQQEPPA